MEFEEYERKFNEKIDYFKNHKDYPILRKQADEVLQVHTSCGVAAIRASDFMDRIISADLFYIEDWLNEKNQLEWSGIKKEKV